ncbi:FeoA family protein [Flavobacterium soli]|uniref:FeoA family protein n=1 Tax=Flavobacterium soli TaxID=344881 RepID=UPI0004155152|nr:FeoA family protein [Flavobacterium soli]
MQTTIDQLRIGQSATITDFDIEVIPLKLIEMGCLPGNSVELLQIAPFGDPLFLNINDSYLAIRLETARKIQIELIQE